MATSDTGSSMAQWAGLYHAVGRTNGAASESTVVTTTAAATTTASSPTSGVSGGSPTRAQPGIEGGRVGKPARRRSRASRRAPVTLLNTDTTNFRAMVQQFTGIPSCPYVPPGGGALVSGAGTGPVISFGAADYTVPVRPSPTSAVMSFDHLPQRPSLQEQLFRPQHQYNDAGGYGAAMHSHSNDMFLHSFESAEDRLLLQSIQAAQMLPRPASTNNTTTNGYNFG